MPTRLAISKETKPIAVCVQIVMMVTILLLTLVMERRRMTISIVSFMKPDREIWAHHQMVGKSQNDDTHISSDTEHWPPEKVEEGLCSGQVVRGRLHVPSFQTDTAYVVTETSAESREVWVPVTGFVGRNRALHGDEVAALPLWSPYRADGTKSEPGPSVPEPPIP
ncbi:unnamed protein product, partial [Symbiodinium microadriaticum]